MEELIFKEVDASLWYAEMAKVDKSGFWIVREPDSPYGPNDSDMFDCSIMHYSNNYEKYMAKHLGSFPTLRKAKAYLNFLWENGKNYGNLSEVEYIINKDDFILP